MNRFLFVGACLVVGSSAVLAQDLPIREGTYYGEGEGGDLTIDLSKAAGEAYDIAIDTVVASEGDFPGCAGGIAGKMTMVGNTGSLSVANPDYDSAATDPIMGKKACEITLTFTKDGFLVVEEKEGCLSFHGAGCAFSGKLVHESAAN